MNALIECAGGMHVLYHGGFSSQSDHYELRIEGTRGVLRCRGIHMSNDHMEYEFAARGEKFIRRQDLDAGLGKHSVYRCGAAGHTRIGVLRDEVWEDSGGVRKAARGRAGAR